MSDYVMFDGMMLTILPGGLEKLGLCRGQTVDNGEMARVMEYNTDVVAMDGQNRAASGRDLHTVETCASEVLGLRLALSLIEMGAEPAGVIAAIRKRDALCAGARQALRTNKDLNRVLAIARRTGIAHGRLEEIDRTDCAFTPSEARAILTAFREAAALQEPSEGARA